MLLSITEGEDKPLQYSTIFNGADVVLLTKGDLAQAVEIDWEAAVANGQAVRPGVRILKVSAKTGAGMPDRVDFLRSAR